MLPDDVVPRVTLLDMLGDNQPDSSPEFVYSLRLPCAVKKLPASASATVKNARAYLHGPDDNLVCSMDHRVVMILSDLIRESAEKHLLASEELHLALALVNHKRNGAILLGGINSRFMIQSQSYSREEIKSLTLEEMKRLIADRPEVPLLDLETFARIMNCDRDAWEKAVCLKPI